jgi:large subunit ribosomal protein L7/L12
MTGLQVAGVVAVLLLLAIGLLVRGSGAAQRTPRAMEPGDWWVVLQAVGPKPIQLIRVIRDVTGAGLVEARVVLDDVPTILRRDLSPTAAEELAEMLRRTGATATAAQMEVSS